MPALDCLFPDFHVTEVNFILFEPIILGLCYLQTTGSN